jgi:hypothetical protein
MSGYSGTPLFKKLGYKPNQKVCVLNEPNGYQEWLQHLPENVEFYSLKERASFSLIHLFCTTEAELHNLLPIAKEKMDINGTIWVSWIKKASKNYKWTITDMDVRNYGLMQGLVDTKICAVNEDWSGLKFMYRLEDRKKK